MAELLEVHGLRHSFGDFVAVDDLDLQLLPQRLTSIIGPNGAGKTTLINLVTGLLAPDGGRILFDGDDITRLPAHARVRRGLGRSFQVSTVFPQLTVGENVLIPVLARRGTSARAFAGVRDDAASWEEVERRLDAFELSSFRDTAAGTLAHGSERMLEVAMALATEPRLCLLDEPCAGLNPTERRRILDLIQRLEDETQTTFVVVEHDMDVVFAVSDWIVVLDRGRVLSEGPPERIRSDPAVREIYLGEEASS